jgi:hypothetical protein
VHTVEGQANFHAYMIAGEPPLPTFAPWGLGSDPYDVATADQAKFCAVGEAAGPLPAAPLPVTALPAWP